MRIVQSYVLGKRNGHKMQNKMLKENGFFSKYGFKEDKKMGTAAIYFTGLNGSMGAEIGAADRKGKGGSESGQVKNGSIFAGNINNITYDRIEWKRAMARKQASKALLDQFAADHEVTDKMDELRARNVAIDDEISYLTDEKRGYEKEQEALKEKYGIEPDSEWQKQLDLIRKANREMKAGQLGNLSKEELEQIANMDKPQLTEYQRRSLEYDKVIENFESSINELKEERIDNNAYIKGAKQGLLKTSYKRITKAYKEADTILKAASDEIIGMVWEDAKKHIDEEMEELIEAAKKKAEEKEEQEEKLEAVKEKKDNQKEFADAIQEEAAEWAKLQNEIDKILKDAELLEEDMKGLMVDGTL